MTFKLYSICRQLDLLCIRADRISAGLCRDSLIRRIEDLNVEHHLLLAKLAVSEEQS
jgi:hypothetical protein